MTRNERQAELARIHIAKKSLNMSDEDYRAVLLRQGGQQSARDLDAGARRKVLAYLDAISPERPRRAFGQAEKIAWLWRKLGQAGALRDQSQAALLAFVGRTTGVGVAHLRFLPSAEASAVIEALKAMLNRSTKAQ